MENNNTILSFDDKHHNGLLRGHVRVMLENPETKERTLWYENDNIIPISGMDVILMKMFNLHLDSIHDPSKSYEDIGQDTNLVIPDLNYADQMNIGIDPSKYDVMDEDIISNYCIQGFMVGNGGSNEDSITSKNTDYSYINLRSPIPFQQSVNDDIDPSIAGMYLGNYRQSGNIKNFYIKKFDARPHLVHSWWKENQAWDYVDPVTQADLGPNAQETPRSNRIETYAEAEMSINIKDGDCRGYFTNGEGQNQAAQINELGLVAFDARKGSNSIVTDIYNRYITRLIDIIFNDNRDQDDETEAHDIAVIINSNTIMTGIQQSNINAFMNDVISPMANTTTYTADMWTGWQTACEDENNIHVEPFYKHSGAYAYSKNDFMEDLGQAQLPGDQKYDEANRIKLVTYYTFDAIPLKENWNIIINYRIYAN